MTSSQRLLKAFRNAPRGARCSLLLRRVPLLSLREFTKQGGQACVGLDHDSRLFPLSECLVQWKSTVKTRKDPDFSYSWVKCPRTRATVLFWKPATLDTLLHDSDHYHIRTFRHSKPNHPKPWVADTSVLLYFPQGHALNTITFLSHGMTQITAHANLETRLRKLAISLYQS